MNDQPREISVAADLPRGTFQLTTVNLTDNRQVSDAGLGVFNDCKNLKTLILFSPNVSDAGLAHFKNFKNLLVLFVFGPKVTDTGLAYFKDCKNLVIFVATSTRTTDAGRPTSRTARA